MYIVCSLICVLIMFMKIFTNTIKRICDKFVNKTFGGFYGEKAK